MAEKAGGTLYVDTTSIEANASMKSIRKKASGDSWSEYLRKLAQAERMEDGANLS